jgi:hypothetical protein
MSYRGLTMGLTYTEYANLHRILLGVVSCETHPRWDRKISESIVSKISFVMEVTPDGTSSTHGPADA